MYYRLFKLPLNIENVKDNEKVRDEEPCDASVLVDNLPHKMVLDLRQLFFALVTVHRPADLDIQVHDSASAAVAIDQEALDTARASTALRPATELADHSED